MSDHFLLEIRVRPGATRTKIGGVAGEPPRLIVAVQAPALDGKANAAVLKELAKAFRDLGLRVRDFAIVHGELARDKRVLVRVSDSQRSEVQARYSELLGVLL